MEKNAAKVVVFSGFKPKKIGWVGRNAGPANLEATLILPAVTGVELGA